MDCSSSFCDLHRIVRQLTYALPLRDYLNVEDILRLPSDFLSAQSVALKARYVTAFN